MTGQLTPGSKCSEQEPCLPLWEALTRERVGCPFDILHGASTSLTLALRTTYPHLPLLSLGPSCLEVPRGQGPCQPEIRKALSCCLNHLSVGGTVGNIVSSTSGAHV